jgi:hypothetical protein
VAATQAKSPGTAVHYLRTTNPLNPENLAVYPRRVGTNRPNAYMRARGSDDLPRGLAVYEDRHCGNPVPPAVNEPPLVPELPSVPVPSVPGLPVPVPSVVADLPSAEEMQELIPDELLDRIFQYAYDSGTVPAPPCRKQGPFNYGGATTQYPHVTAGTGR